MQRNPRCTRRTVLIFLSPALALATVLQAQPALAAWIPGGNVLASGPNNQSVPLLTSDGAGGVFVVWQDGAAPAGSQLIGQHVGSDGTFLWAPAGVTIPIPFNSGDGIYGPSTDQQGGSIVISGASLSTDRAQRLNSAGTAQWGATGVDFFTTTPLNSPIFAVPIPAGGTSPTTDPVGVIATWEEKISSSGDLDIYAQRLNASGTAIWGTLATPIAVCNASGDQYGEVICTDGPSGPSNTHGAFVAWYDLRSSPAATYVNRLSNQGAPSWPNGIQLSGEFATVTAGPYIDYFGSNSALVVWVEGNATMRAQKVLLNGTLAWTPGGNSICSATGAEALIHMVPSGSGGELLAWTDTRNDVADVYAQAIDANGNPLWGTAGLPVCVEPSRELVDGMVADGSGGAFVFWFDKRDGINSNLFGQHLDLNGNALWTANGLELAPLHSPGVLELEALADGAGGFFLVWQDKVSGALDSFISRFNSSGNTVVLAAEPATPGAFGLALASPNPARDGARFSVQMTEDGMLSAQVLDLEGRVVRELAGTEALSAGPHTLAWDGRNESGERALPGVYFAVARVGTMSRMLKLVELR